MTIAWILLSAFIVVCALGVVLARGPISSAISLLVGFLGVAILYLMLKAEFVAAVQVLVYAGGILVLYIFGIMLTDNEALRLTRQSHFQAWPVFALVLVLFLWMGHKLYHSDYTPQPQARIVVMADGAGGQSAHDAMARRAKEQAESTNTQKLAGVLYGDYLYPFEAASVLLLVAVLGAVFLAKKEV
jgi:NADH-quinone oxidoreductase subunit J